MGQARLSRDVGEGAVAVVVKEIARRLAVADFGIEAAAVDEEDVEPAVFVVVEEGYAAAHFLEQELLVGRTPRNVQGLGQTSRCGHVREDARAAVSTLDGKPTRHAHHGEAGIGRGDERGPEELQEPAARSGAASFIRGASPLGLPDWLARGGPTPRAARQPHSLPLVRATLEIAAIHAPAPAAWACLELRCDASSPGRPIRARGA